MSNLRVLVVNLNNLNYTKNCVKYLLNQKHRDFKITLVDQNSSEEGTKEFLNSIEDDRVEVVLNDINIPLNHVWNWFSNSYEEELLCFLNNDVIIPNNFIGDTIEVFNNEKTVGIVVHSTNHKTYQIQKKKLEYEVVEKFKYMQGWDYTIRRKLFDPIPLEIKTYCGDDFTFNNVYEKGYDLAYCISSPMIHFEGQSKKFMKTSGVEDIVKFRSMGYKHYLKINEKYSKIKPQFNKIIYEN